MTAKTWYLTGGGMLRVVIHVWQSWQIPLSHMSWRCSVLTTSTTNPNPPPPIQNISWGPSSDTSHSGYYSQKPHLYLQLPPMTTNPQNVYDAACLWHWHHEEQWERSIASKTGLYLMSVSYCSPPKNTWSLFLIQTVSTDIVVLF